MKERFSFTIRYRKCIIGWEQQNLQVLVGDFIFKLVKSNPFKVLYETKNFTLKILPWKCFIFGIFLGRKLIKTIAII